MPRWPQTASKVEKFPETKLIFASKMGKCLDNPEHKESATQKQWNKTFIFYLGLRLSLLDLVCSGRESAGGESHHTSHTLGKTHFLRKSVISYDSRNRSATPFWLIAQKIKLKQKNR